MTRPDWLEPLDDHTGFTGTRRDPTDPQKAWLLEYMYKKTEHPNNINVAHHGCCIGADAFFHSICKSLMATGHLQSMVLHPPTDRSREMEIDEWTLTSCLWYPRKPYLMRNKDIVNQSGTLVALPASGPTRGSGTWHTIHQAQGSGKNILICYPDGIVKQRHADGTETRCPY